MFIKERRDEIVVILFEQGKVEVNELAKRFSTSRETIRSDLNYLDGLGLLERCYGGAVLKKRSLINNLSSEIENILNSIKYKKSKIKDNSMSGYVCIIGSFNVDIVCSVPRFPNPGETLIANRTHFGPGGKGANQALAASKALAQVHFVAKIGKDKFSEFAYNHLTSSLVDGFTLYQSDTLPTGNAVIYVSEENGENMIAIDRGANMALTESEINQAYHHIDLSNVLLVQLESNLDAILQSVKYASDNKKRVILNPAPYSEDIEQIIPYVNIITPNKTEAEFISGMKITDIKSAKLAADKISMKGPEVVIITLGSEGALVKNNNSFTLIPAFPALAVDTTGAGDAFNGAFSAALANGDSLLDACRYASAFASLAVEREGASNMPTHEQVLARLSTHALSNYN